MCSCWGSNCFLVITSTPFYFIHRNPHHIVITTVKSEHSCANRFFSKYCITDRCVKEMSHQIIVLQRHQQYNSSSPLNKSNKCTSKKNSRFAIVNTLQRRSLSCLAKKTIIEQANNHCKRFSQQYHGHWATT